MPEIPAKESVSIPYEVGSIKTDKHYILYDAPSLNPL